MKTEIGMAPSFFDARSVDADWLTKAASERLRHSEKDLFENVVWRLVWLLAILVLVTAVLGGAAILQGLSQFDYAPLHQSSMLWKL